jgi:endoglucanase
MSSIYSFLQSLLHTLTVALLAILPSSQNEHTKVAAFLPVTPSHRTVMAAMRSPDTGYWHTSGSRILDARNQPVRIEGINWYGFETTREIPGGLMVQDYRTILQTIKSSGFNTVRLPLSNQMVESPIVPRSISYTNDTGAINTDLRGLNSLQILDRVVEYAGTLGLKVILDNHRSEAGDSAEQSGLWYTDEYPESAWLSDWKTLATRYAGNTTVIGVDLRNEPHNAGKGGACWDCGGPNDWHNAATRAGNAVLRINPNLLIFTEGVDAYNNDYYWWGGNLEGVRTSPVRLELPNHLVYSPHEYGPREYAQSWFNASTTRASLQGVWRKHWAFISERGIAPVWIGEFGTTNKAEDIRGEEPGSEGQWYQSLVGFLQSEPQLSWAAWALNGEDAYGLMNEDYTTAANPMKQQMLAGLMLPTNPALGTQTEPQTTVAENTFPQIRTTQTPRYSVETPNYAPTAMTQVSQPARPMRTSMSSQQNDASRQNTESVCHVTYRSVNDSGSDFTGVIEIANRGNQPVEGWTLLWLYDGGQEISQSRSASYKQNGDMVMMTNTNANGLIPAGGKLANITFQTTYRGRNIHPAKFYLNGTLCA